ncbi:MAG: hypothetical protein ACRD96_08735 [Bryobacteraceae bacterium]
MNNAEKSLLIEGNPNRLRFETTQPDCGTDVSAKKKAGPGILGGPGRGTAFAPRVTQREVHANQPTINARQTTTFRRNVMRKTARVFAGIMTGLLVTASSVLAQNPASNKAFFAKSANEITFATVSGVASPVIDLITIPAAVKTSNGGAVSATLSMETLLSTYNITTAIVNGGKSSSSSRATLRAWVEVDDVVMEPGDVVFNDRLQATGLKLDLTCAVPLTTCEVSGQLILDLFQQTKSANSFTFFLGPLSPTTHKVVVKAQGVIECRDSAGTVIGCPTGILAGYQNASTQVGIGKATLMIEEQQNWGAQQ